MYDLSTFSLHDMTECGAALRTIGVGATSLEEVVQGMVQYLYANLGDRQTGANHCALVRLFLTRPYGELDADCRRCAQEALGGAPDSPSMPCLVLMGTAGERSEWNDTKNSRRYRAVPLPSEQFVDRFPMFSQLLKQLGVETQAILNADSTLLADHEERTYNVFHVPEAAGSPYIPVQENFVAPFGIRSVLGFGGLLPSGQLFALIIFSKTQISRETADLFKTLALSAKLALLPFDGPPGPNGSGPDRADLARLRSELTTLRRLHEVQQDTVAVQTGRLEGALKEVRLRAQELEESQKDLRRQTRLFESMLRGMAEGVVVTDLDGQVLLANEVAKRVLGLSLYQPASPNGQPAPPVEHQPAQAGEGSVPLLGMLQGKVTGAEVSVDPGSGIGAVWLSVNAGRLRDDRGLVKANLLVFHDITYRKQAEEALKQSEERYRSIFENAVEGIFQTTCDGKYVAVNPALARMYGYDSPDDMIATIRDIAGQLYVDPGRRDEFIRLMQAQEEVTGFEAQVYRRDGAFIWISECARTVRDFAGVLVGYEGTVEHITQRKLGEERLRATLDHVRTLSGRLAAVQEEERTHIARELHDELGVRLTCLKIDLSRLPSIVGDDIGGAARAKLDDKVHSMVEQVDDTIASVQRLVTQLRPALLDNLGLVAAIEWQSQDFQKRTGIPCACVIIGDDIAIEPERATAVLRICQEALTNTTRHAQATAVMIQLFSQHDSLQLMVTDNGVGIPDTKASDLRSLGLLGMQERAAQFGGTITIEGDPEKGTTVTLCLPVDRRQPES